VAAIDTSWYDDILEANQNFDLNTPLTAAELVQAGMLHVLLADRPQESGNPVLKDLDEVEDAAPVDAVAEFINSDSYNARYAYYLKCQAIAALVAFDEGWKGFEELILKPYVQARKRENAEYRGDDPNKVFSLRVRQQAAEDFIRFIRVMLNEAIATPKPALEVKM